MVMQGGSVQLGDIYDDQSWGRGGNTDGSPCRVDGWRQNNETFAVWQEWMAHVKVWDDHTAADVARIVEVTMGV